MLQQSLLVESKINVYVNLRLLFIKKLIKITETERSTEDVDDFFLYFLVIYWVVLRHERWQSCKEAEIDEFDNWIPRWLFIDETLSWKWWNISNNLSIWKWWGRLLVSLTRKLKTMGYPFCQSIMVSTY